MEGDAESGVVSLAAVLAKHGLQKELCFSDCFKRWPILFPLPGQDLDKMLSASPEAAVTPNQHAWSSGMAM